MVNKQLQHILVNALKLKGNVFLKHTFGYFMNVRDPEVIVVVARSRQPNVRKAREVLHVLLGLPGKDRIPTLVARWRHRFHALRNGLGILYHIQK